MMRLLLDLVAGIRRTATALVTALAAAVAVTLASTALPAPAQVPDAHAASQDQLAGAVRLFELGRFAEAETQLRELVHAAPTPEAAYYLGRVYFAEDSVDRAVDAFASAVHLNAASSAAHDWLARAYTVQLLNSNRFRQFLLARRVRDELERAVALDTSNALARYDLARYYLNAPGIVGGSMAKAKAHAAELAHQGSLYAHYAAADIAERERDSTRAVAELEAALAEAPDSASAYMNYAAYDRRAGRWADAWRVIDLYAARHVDDAELDFEVGATGARAGEQLERARHALLSYLTRPWRPGTPTFGSTHLHLGLIDELLGDRAAARREYETAVALQPRNEEARMRAERMR